MQSGHDGGEVYQSLTWRQTIVVAQMHVPQFASSHHPAEGVRPRRLLDVHMIRVQQQPYCRVPHRLQECQPLVSVVDQVSFITIEGFYCQANTSGLSVCASLLQNRHQPFATATADRGQQPPKAAHRDQRGTHRRRQVNEIVQSSPCLIRFLRIRMEQ